MSEHAVGRQVLATYGELVREVAALREQLATAQRERDEWKSVAEAQVPGNPGLQILFSEQTKRSAAERERDRQYERAGRLAAELAAVAPYKMPDSSPCWCDKAWAYKRADVLAGHRPHCTNRRALLDETTTPPAHPPTCTWTEDDEGAYATGCGNAFIFTDGAPADNKMRFCGYCGKTLMTVRFVEQAARDDEEPQR